MGNVGLLTGSIKHALIGCEALPEQADPIDQICLRDAAIEHDIGFDDMFALAVDHD